MAGETKSLLMDDFETILGFGDAFIELFVDEDGEFLSDLVDWPHGNTSNWVEIFFWDHSD